MKPLQDCKLVQINSDMTVDNAAFTTAEIDTKGYGYATIIASFGNVPANVASMTVTEADVSATNHAAFITVGTTAAIDGATSALPTASGGDGDIIVFEIDLAGRKRYLDLTCTAGDGSGTVTEMSAVCILSQAKIAPSTESGRGADQIIRV